MVPTRDPFRTRERILAAALAEFSAKGFAGARVDAIARRARINKRMLYHYFGAKEQLYREVLRRKIAERAGFVASTPDDPAEGLLYWYEMGSRDLHWVRLMEWEALAVRGKRLLAGKERRRLFHQATRKLRAAQVRGLLARNLDPGQLFISMIALTTFPLAFPQMVRLVTGQGPSDRRFRRERIEFLRWFADRLRQAGGAGRPRRPASPPPGPDSDNGERDRR